MDKDEILEKSRKENRNADFVEGAVLARANAIALGVGMVVSGILSVLHAIFADKPDCAVWTVYFSVLAAVMLVKFAKLRRRHELLLGLLYAGFCVFFFVCYLHFTLGLF